MKMWDHIHENLKSGQIILTPGKGIPALNQQTFYVISIGSDHIEIDIGKSRTRNKLCRKMFDAVEDYFRRHPHSCLRIAAVHDMVPTKDSVDEVVRAAVHFPRAIGNYIAAILVASNCTRYKMIGDKKYIEIISE